MKGHDTIPTPTGVVGDITLHDHSGIGFHSVNFDHDSDRAFEQGPEVWTKGDRAPAREYIKVEEGDLDRIVHIIFQRLDKLERAQS